ncbi:MAG: hypothetical protein ACKOFP_07375, partial [Actinomycetota bacterium]
GKEGNPMAAAYSASKAAVIGMTKSVGKDVAGPGGVWVISQEGEHLGTINSDEVVGNHCWGDDWHSLFLCTSTTVHVLTTTVAGHRSAAFR